MRSIVKYIVLLIAGTTLTLSCRQYAFEDMLSQESGIKLVAAMPGTVADLTKASGVESYDGLLNNATVVDGGLVVGMLRVDQTGSDYSTYGVSNLGFTGVNDGTTGTFNPQSINYSDGSPYYYYSEANLAGNAGVRNINFDILQYFKQDDDIVHYYGWYPFGTPDASGKFKVNFSLDGKTDVLYSSVATHIANNRTDTLSLHHALCQYRIWVYRKPEIGEDGVSSSKGAGRWGRIDAMTIHNQRDRATWELPASFTYSYSSSTHDAALKTLLPNATLGSDGKVTGDEGGVFFITQEVTSTGTHGALTIPVGLENKRKIACFMAPPPEDDSFSLSVHTDATEESESTNQKELTVAGNFQKGYAYDIILCFSDHGIVNAVANVGQWTRAAELSMDVDAKIYYDLSRYGTANCYMVCSSNADYSFQGNVKGCGNDLGGGTIVGVDDCSLPDDSYIDILYQSSDNLIKLDASTLVNGKVLFTVPGSEEDPGSLALVKKGNAIIAARKEKDGEILWSWHIWVTDRPQDQGYLNGYYAMDRNIGALSGPRTENTIGTMTLADTTSYGLLYQWGRKDPMIPGVTTWSDDALGSTDACIEAGIKNPLLMYSNWDVDAIASIMGYRESQDNIKSIYDPCPPGYRIPETEAYSTLASHKKTITLGGISGGVFSGDSYDYVFFPDCGFVSANSTTAPLPPYAPTSGSKIKRTGANDGNGEIYLYTTDPEDFIEGMTGTTADIYTIPDGSENTSKINYRTNQEAGAFAMRCISVGSKTRVVDLCESQTANCYVVPAHGVYKFRVDIKGNGVNRTNLAGSMRNIDYNTGGTIDVSTINHVAVLWWQGDISGRKSNNTAGTDCPIKFVSDASSLPRSPSHSSTAFSSNDLAVPDEEGYVQFYIAEGNWGRGNAVVAAFDESNNVIWSWHLWLTETPEIINLGPTTSSKDSYTYEYSIMDRNLGATCVPTASDITDTYALASIGLYYQWGRKDPIQGPQTLSQISTSSSGTNTQPWYKRNTSGDWSWTTMSAIETAAANESPEVATANPSVFYTNNYNATLLVDRDYYLFEKNWYGEKFGWSYTWWKQLGGTDDRNLTQENTYSFVGRWGYNTPNHDYINDPPMTKTMYDPCPPGYYIPPQGMLVAAGLTDSVTVATNKYSSSSFAWAAEKTWTTGSETRGVFVSSSAAVSKTMWIPFGGYRHYEDGQFNTSHFGSYSNKAAVWYTGLDYESRMYEYQSGVRSLVITASGAGSILGQRPGDAANVRCRAY